MWSCDHCEYINDIIYVCDYCCLELCFDCLRDSHVLYTKNGFICNNCYFYKFDI